MRTKHYWGLGVLIILIIAVGGFVFYQQWTEREQLKEAAEADNPLEEPIAQSDEPIVSSDKPITKDDLPAAAEGFKWVQHGDHWHQVPIDAPDTWQGEPHEPITQPSPVAAFPDITSLEKLSDDIDPDDIPPFTVTPSDGYVYNYNRPLTPEEREMYYTVKAKYNDDTPSTLKSLAINLVREQKIKDGAFHPFLEDWGKGILTDEELNQRLDEFFERTRSEGEGVK